MLQASPERLADDLNVLASDIGVRLAGTSGERAAADHIIARAREIGADTREEIFPVQSRGVAEEQLEVRAGIRFRQIVPGSDTQGLDARADAGIARHHHDDRAR